MMTRPSKERRIGLLTDIGLRAIGLCAMAVGAISIEVLTIINNIHPRELSGARAFALAMIAFLCISSGTALLVLGKHIYDQVKVSERWTRRPTARPQQHDVVMEIAAMSRSSDREVQAYRRTG